MKLTTNRYIILLTTVTIAMVALVFFLKESLLKEPVLIGWTFALLGFFYLYELLVTYVVTKKKKVSTSKQMINIYLGLKVARIILFLMLVAIYALAVKVETKLSILVFVLLYFVYLLCDTLYLTNTEKKLKKQ